MRDAISVELNARIFNHEEMGRPLDSSDTYQQWGTIRRPPYHFSRTSQQTDDPDFGSVSANVDGTLRCYTNILQPDPSANVYMFNWASVTHEIRVPYDSSEIAVGGKFRRRGHVYLRIVDRNGPSTLDLYLYQRLFFTAFYWDGAAWVNLGVREKELFLERRDYDVGEGGDDDRTWPFDDFVEGSAFFAGSFPAGTYLRTRIGIYTGDTYAASNFSLTTTNEMNADVLEMRVSGNE